MHPVFDNSSGRMSTNDEGKRRLRHTVGVIKSKFKGPDCEIKR